MLTEDLAFPLPAWDEERDEDELAIISLANSAPRVYAQPMATKTAVPTGKKRPAATAGIKKPIAAAGKKKPAATAARRKTGAMGTAT